MIQDKGIAGVVRINIVVNTVNCFAMCTVVSKISKLAAG
jgi:hypothetical protein